MLYSHTVVLTLLLLVPLATAKRTLLTKGDHMVLHNDMSFPVGIVDLYNDGWDPKTQPPPVVILPGQSHEWTSKNNINLLIYRMCPGQIDGKSVTWVFACLLVQDNPNIGAPYIGLQCSTHLGTFHTQR